MIGWILLGLVLIFILILVVRALRFKPEELPPMAEEPVALDHDKIVQDMADMIRCATVSHRDEELIDRSEFAKFEALLPERFPRIYAACSFEKVGKTGLIFKLKGQSCEKPSVCMAHYDVVPADESEWSKPPFSGLVEDGFIWGRGTLDTKGTLCGVMEALEAMLAEGYVPKNDLYLAFSGEEEIDGDSCRDMVAYLKAKGIKPAIVLDEGGAVVNNVFPGVNKECAVVGIAEKGGVNFKFTLESKGGHASTPPVKTVLGQLSQAVTRIESHPFKRQLTKPVAELFDTLGRHSTFVFRLIFANLWCFAPLLDLICKKSGGELNALMRTTTAVTRFEGSPAYNVLPSRASFGVNMRLLGTDTMESAKAYLEKVIKHPAIKVEMVSGMNPSINSDTSCDEWEVLKSAIHQTWPEAIVSPYLMMACSDSRHYCAITDRVYRFSAMRMSKEERGMIHGIDERVPVETMIKTAEFYVRFLRML